MAKRRRFPGRATMVWARRRGQKVFATVHVKGGGFNPVRKYHVTLASKERLLRLARSVNDAWENATEPCAYVPNGRALCTIFWRKGW